MRKQFRMSRKFRTTGVSGQPSHEVRKIISKVHKTTVMSTEFTVPTRRCHLLQWATRFPVRAALDLVIFDMSVVVFRPRCDVTFQCDVLKLDRHTTLADIRWASINAAPEATRSASARQAPSELAIRRGGGRRK